MSKMAVMMISDIAGQTAAGYDGLLGMVRDHFKSAPGFVAHSGHPTATGWRVVEIWESREDAGRFFAAHVAPYLPEGIHPKLTFEPLHALVH
jgi:hypothetical protein